MYTKYSSKKYPPQGVLGNPGVPKKKKKKKIMSPESRAVTRIFDFLIYTKFELHYGKISYYIVFFPPMMRGERMLLMMMAHTPLHRTPRCAACAGYRNGDDGNASHGGKNFCHKMGFT